MSEAACASNHHHISLISRSCVAMQQDAQIMKVLGAAVPTMVISLVDNQGLVARPCLGAAAPSRKAVLH